MNTLWNDIRYAFRLLVKAPGFTAIAVLTIALGIGANTAVFSVVYSVLLKPLPFRDPSRLLTVWDTYLPQFAKVGVSPAELQAWQQQHDLFRETAWFRYVPFNLDLTSPGSEAVVVHGDFISTQLFPMLGVAPARGRAFNTSDDPHSVLLSDQLWRSRFAGDPGILGRTIRLNEDEFTVIGIMPAESRFPEWADIWLPQGPLLGDQLTNPVRHALGFVARLRSGVTAQQASARLTAISQRLAAEHPKTSTGWGLRVSGLQDDLTASVRPALLILLGAASLVLLIACGNVANLLLSRSAGRAKEIAVRTAMGASAWRIVRQLVTESLVLAVLGGVLGGFLANAALAMILRTPVKADSTVFLFLVGTSLMVGVFFGLAPALQALRSEPQSVIKSGSVTSSGAPVRGALVVLEFALTLMLVVGAGILTKSFLRLMNVDPGFNAHGLLTLRIFSPPSRQPEILFHRIQDRILRLPGVQAVAMTNALPLIGDRANTTRFNVPGSPLIRSEALPAAQIHTASPEYFRAMQIPLRSGRTFTEKDLNQPVVIINQTMARRFWPGQDPVGLKFVTGPWGPNPSWSTIVGVVSDVKQFGLDSEPSLDLYFPSLAPGYLVVKTASNPLSIANAVQQSLRAIDPDLAISEVRSMDQIAIESARTQRWTMGLLAGFAAVALLLALVGIYGVMAWSVEQRTREIGIRIALGAPKDHVLKLVIGYGMKLTAIGLMAGLCGAFAFRHVLSGLVYGVSTADPVIYGVVPLLMMSVAILACYIPARRVIGVDPLTALRWE